MRTWIIIFRGFTKSRFYLGLEPMRRDIFHRLTYTAFCLHTTVRACETSSFNISKWIKNTCHCTEYFIFPRKICVKFLYLVQNVYFWSTTLTVFVGVNSKWLADILELKHTLFVQIIFFHQFRINQEKCHLNAKVGIDKEQNRTKIFSISKWVGCSRRSRVEIPNFSCNPKIILLNCSMPRLSEK